MMARPLFATVSEERFWRIERALLAAAFAAVLALLLLLAWKAPEFMLVLPALFLLGAAVRRLGKHPLLNLCIIVGGFVLTLQQSDGFDAAEAIYAVYLVSYLLGWFAFEFAERGMSVFQSAEDLLLLGFLILGTASIGTSIIFRAEPAEILSGWYPLLVLSLFYPLKETCRRYPEALRYLLIAFALLTIFIVVRNFYYYMTRLGDAKYVWQIINGRARLNERLLFIAFTGSLSLALYIRRAAATVPLFVFSAFLLAGIIIGQGRAVWMAVALTIGILFVLSGGRERMRLSLLAVGASLLVIVAMGFILDNFANIVAHGLTRRFTSLETATTKDLSLVNRFYEWKAAGALILQNPFLGYGFGREYAFYDIIENITVRKSFIHNMYMGVTYRHGIMALVLLLSFWGVVIWKSFRAFRLSRLDSWERPMALATFAALVGLALANATEPMFTSDEGTFAVAFLGAVATALWHRVTARENPHTPAAAMADV